MAKIDDHYVEVDLAHKARAQNSRAKSAPTKYRRLLTPKGEICEETKDLPVPVKVVIEHDKLVALSGKVPTCNEEGNPNHNARLPIFYWFQDTPGGKEIYLVMYTGACAWNRCSFCTLPSESSPAEVSADDIYSQVLFVFDSLSREQLDQTRRLFLSNNGSVLDIATMPRHTLTRIFELAHEQCPYLEVICLETRFESVAKAELLVFQHYLDNWHHLYKKSGRFPRQAEQSVSIQIIAGYETQDPYLRNAILWKGFDEEDVQKFFALLKETSETSGRDIMIDEYVMLKPAANLSQEDAIEEAVETIVHLEKLGQYYSVPISVRVNPTYAAVGSELHYAFENQDYTPPTYRDVYQVILRCHERNVQVPIFLGLNNEGLSFSSGSFGNQDGTDPFYKKALRAYNSHQDIEKVTEEIEIIENRLNNTDEGKLLLDLFELQSRLGPLEDYSIGQLSELLGGLEAEGLPSAQVREMSSKLAKVSERIQ